MSGQLQAIIYSSVSPFPFQPSSLFLLEGYAVNHSWIHNLVCRADPEPSAESIVAEVWLPTNFQTSK